MEEASVTDAPAEIAEEMDLTLIVNLLPPNAQEPLLKHPELREVVVLSL